MSADKKPPGDPKKPPSQEQQKAAQPPRQPGIDPKAEIEPRHIRKSLIPEKWRNREY
jgi:hypothetical protein